MPVFLALLSFGSLALANIAPAQLQQQPLLSRTNQQYRDDGNGVCPYPPALSCQRGNPGHIDTCCMNSPGGQFALTQFWNTDASKGSRGYIGPKEAFTLHGLWPDHCDGSYDSACDRSRSGECYGGRRSHCNHAYSSVTNILRSHQERDLLSNMTTYWKGIHGDESIWSHEWNKHGTCVSTLHPRCYGPDYKSTQEVVDYFSAAMDLYKTLPTFEWLKSAGIVPSRTVTYDMDDIYDALTVQRGVSPVLACQGNELREVWYHFLIRGSVRDGGFEASDPVLPSKVLKGCPRRGIRYLPKDDDSWVGMQ